MTLLHQTFANADKSMRVEPTVWPTLSLELDQDFESQANTNQISVVTDDYLTLAEEAGLSATNEVGHKSKLVLATTLKPSQNPLATHKTESKPKPATEVLFIKSPSRNVSTKYLSIISGLACMLIFTGVQAYTYLANSASPVASLPKLLAPKLALANVQPTTIRTVKYKLETQVSSKAISKAISKVISNKIATEIVIAKELPAKKFPVQLITHVPTASVDVTLLEAYRALIHGEYIVAQQQYRQVLQRDMHNIDALLGMATIARQKNQDADAQVWNQKVLEIDPRNDIALSSLASLQNNKSLSSENLNNKILGSEDLVHKDLITYGSKIKNLLALQPEAASFHAALGNLYAEQDLWPAAQEAFYSACRFAPNNADYAFNLAISLDKMAKYNLALKQYQRTLTLLNQLGVNSPDRTSLEARIKVLEPFND